MAAAFALGDAFAQLAPADNRAGLGEVDMSVVASAHLGIAEVADPSVRFQRRPAGAPAQRFDVHEVRRQAELDAGHPGEGTEILNRTVHFPDCEMTFIAAA